jgi:hypothetical protein
LSKSVKVKICKTIILLLFLYWCEISFFALRGEHRLRIFENRLQRRKLRQKKDEIIKGWGTFRSDEFHNLNSSPNMIRIMKSRSMRWAGHETRMDKKRKVCIILQENQKN